MKKYRWQIIILCVTGFVVGLLLLLERQGGLLNNTSPHATQGGIYTEGIVGSIQRLNPLLDSENAADQDIDRLLFSGLLQFDSRGISVPDLAESWTISQDGTIYNFILKDKLTWHDGQPLTTDDFVFTTDLISKGGSGISSDLSNFWTQVKVIKLDDTHMQFVLPEAFAPFLDYLSFGVLPKHILGNMTYDQMVASSFNLQPVGSGPYKFDSIAVENNSITGITLAAFANYAGNKPYIEKIVFRYFTDSKSAYQAYLNGYVQGISNVSNDVLPDVLANSDLSLYSSRLPKISIILFNLNNTSVKFFQEKEVRAALYLAINRQLIINTVFNGQAIQANGVIFPGTWAYLDSLAPVQFNPEQAQEILKEQGYVVTGDTNPVRKNGEQTLEFVLSYPDDDLHKQIAEMIQSDWNAIHVNVTLEAVPADQFVKDKLDSRGYQAALVDLNLANSPDPDPYPFWDQGQISNGQNYSQWADRTVSDTLEQARVATDFNERIRLYHNFQYLFAEENPALPLFYPVYSFAVDGLVQGVSIGPLFTTSDRFAAISSWYLVSKRSTVGTETPASK
ncbi:MAG: ABC transporter substrate-binding protein [Anaerolineaceae bacterium]